MTKLTDHIQTHLHKSLVHAATTSSDPLLYLHLWTIYYSPLHQHTFTPTADRHQGPRSQPLCNLCSTVLRGHVPVHVVYVEAADTVLTLNSEVLHGANQIFFEKTNSFKGLLGLG